MTDRDDRIRAWGPASLSNLGPGFDALGLCLDGLGDVVEARRSDTPGVRVTMGQDTEAVPVDPMRNTAARAALSVVESVDPDAGVDLAVRKGILPGSGLGSSAASAVAAAWATHRLLGGTDDRSLVVDAALTGESAVSGALHGDNVMPSLMGGLVLVSCADPTRWRRIPIGAPLSIAIVRPDLTVLTREARAMLPASVPLSDASKTASALAFLVDALRAGDLETAGWAIENDRLVEPVRARLVPPFVSIRRAAREAGALGCALTGSGPAMFAFCPDERIAEAAREAMARAAGGGNVRSVLSAVDERGARLTDSERPPVRI